MGSQIHRSSFKDRIEEMFDQSRNHAASDRQDTNISADGVELEFANVSGPRARKPTQRLVDEMASQANYVGASIEEPEDLTMSDRDDQEINDPDYRDSAPEKPRHTPGRMEKPASRASTSILGPPPDWEAKYKQAQRDLAESRQNATNLRKKRTEDRKQCTIEKAERIKQERMVKQFRIDRIKLEGQFQEASEQFAENLEQQQNDFNEAQAAMTKLMQKNESFTITDDVVRNKLKILKSEWKPWARDYAEENFQKCPQALIRKLIDKAAAQKTASQRASIYQKLAAKPSGSAICLNALLAFDVCETTFGDSFLGLLALDDGHEFKNTSNKFLSNAVNGNSVLLSSWRAQTLHLADFRRSDVLQEDCIKETEACEARLQRHYANLATKFLDSVAIGILKRVNIADTVKRRKELESIYREAGNFSICLWKQKTHMRVDICRALQDKFSSCSDSMQPHSSMLLDEDDDSYNGRSPDMIIEPGIFAYGDAQGKNYDMRKYWMKATVLLFDKNLKQELQPLTEADVPKVRKQEDEMAAKHTVDFDNNNHEPKIKRSKTTVPWMDHYNGAQGHAGGTAAMVTRGSRSIAPEVEPIYADVKVTSQKNSTDDDQGPKIRNDSLRASVASIKQSTVGPAKKKEALTEEVTQRSTVATSSSLRALTHTGLRAMMGAQSTIPEMGFLYTVLEEVERPKKRNDVWENQELNALEANQQATEIQKEVHKSTAKRRASASTMNFNKPPGLYHASGSTFDLTTSDDGA